MFHDKKSSLQKFFFVVTGASFINDIILLYFVVLSASKI